MITLEAAFHKKKKKRKKKDTHCRRLCKTTEIFVKKKYVFFYLIFIPTHLGFSLEF